MDNPLSSAFEGRRTKSMAELESIRASATFIPKVLFQGVHHHLFAI
jgi:hypothetical protein